MAQLMPLPLTISCFSKIQIGFIFLVPAHLGSPGKRAVKWVCVCVCVRRKIFSKSGSSAVRLAKYDTKRANKDDKNYSDTTSLFSWARCTMRSSIVPLQISR